ncbi:MAG TPA: hypothetical protein VLA19_12970 [Herpetosiphonaceae bacterium]|nr:hypothetical protein [Herpetosiphonaceae bacterium]
MEQLSTWMLKQYVALTQGLEAEEGQGLVEYALIIALVAVVLAASLTALAGGIDGVYDGIVTAFTRPHNPNVRAACGNAWRTA